jgi:exonuclease SbcC
LKVKIENFEIIKNAELEFKPGLNVIVGPTNNGKSSIFRALESALFNELGDDFINNDENEALVTIENDSNKVVWEKRRHKSPATVYEINGTEYSKVGRTQFQEVADTLNISEVRLTSNNKERLNFWQQMEYPFLLDKTGSQLFEFLSLSSENENLAEVVKEMQGDKKDINQKINKIEGGIDSLQEVVRDEEKYLEDKDGFSELYSEVINVESKISKYENLNSLYNTVVTKEDKLGKIESDYNNLTDFLDVFLEDYRDLGQGLKKLVELKKVLETAIGLKDKINEYENFIDKVEDRLDNIKIGALKVEIDDYLEGKKNLDTIENQIETVENKKSSYEELNSEVGRIKERLDNLEIDSLKDKIDNIRSEKERLGNIDSILNEIEDRYNDEEKLDGNLSSIDEQLDEIEEELNSYDVCPLCNSSI